ncbi:MAG TPA: hypothetical protein VF310_07030 [Vicinamibacteria bacterium]
MSLAAALAVPAGARAEDLLSHKRPVDLIASTGNLYWTYHDTEEGGASIWRASKDTSPGEERLLYQETGNVFLFGSLVFANVSGSWFGYFLAHYQDASGGGTSYLKRIPLAGGAAVTLALSPAYGRGGDLVTDGVNLYWSDSGGLRRMPIGGGAVITMFSGPLVRQVGLDPGFVYFSDGGTVKRMPKTGFLVTTQATNTNFITSLYVHVSGSTTTLYFGDTGGAVRSKRVGDSNNVTHQVSTAGRRVNSVGFDGTRVMWTECAKPDGNECRVRKKEWFGKVTVASGGVGSDNLQWDSGHMYWGEGSGLKKYTH